MFVFRLPPTACCRVTLLFDSPWLDTRIYPAYVGAFSLTLLSARALWALRPTQSLRKSLFGYTPVVRHEVDNAQHASQVLAPHSVLSRVGGATIFVYKLLRLAALLVVTILVAYSSSRDGWDVFDLAMMGTLVRPSSTDVDIVLITSHRYLRSFLPY